MTNRLQMNNRLQHLNRELNLAQHSLNRYLDDVDHHLEELNRTKQKVTSVQDTIDNLNGLIKDEEDAKDVD